MITFDFYKLFSKSFAIVLLALCSTTASISVLAEPYLAQRFGMKCSGCHTNMTGGGKRNDVGNAFAAGLSSTPLRSTFSPKLTDNISIGANFRGDWTFSQFDAPEEVEESGQIADPIEDISAFAISNGSLYLDFSLGDSLLFYIDQQVAPEGGRTREAVAILKNIFGENTWLKAGKFYLPYGLRLQDDKAFIREITDFNFDNSDIGVELGFEPGKWSFSLALSNGSQGAGENNTDKQFSLVGAYIDKLYRIGASASSNNGSDGLSQESYNIFGGLSLGKWVFLAELDWLEDSSVENTDKQLISLVSVDYLLRTSSNIKFSYELLDPNTDRDENERTRTSLIFENFFNQYTQGRLGLRIYEGIPQTPLHNQQQLFAELHLFF